MNTPLPGFGQPEQTEPAVSEVDRLKGLLERRTEALNRTVKELEIERAKLAHVNAIADSIVKTNWMLALDLRAATSGLTWALDGEGK